MAKDKPPKQHTAPEYEKQVQEYESLLKRVQADFDNYRKHVEQERPGLVSIGKEAIITKLLPILDNFDLAMRNCADPEEFKKGIELIYAELKNLLQAEGLQPIESIGKPLNTDLHDVLLTRESDHPEDTIVEELQQGYTLKDKVIRHAKVAIAKPKQAHDTKPEPQH